MMNVIFNSSESKEFLSVSKELRLYCRSGTTICMELTERFKIALNNYRNYLDKMGCKMPDPSYKYVNGDEKTWKYSGYSKGNKYVKWISNPKFAY